MSNDRTNFLPETKQRAFRTGYFLRLGIVAFLLLSTVIAVHGLLLFGVYTYAKDKQNTLTMQLNQVAKDENAQEDSLLKKRLKTLSTKAARLTPITASVPASETLRSLLGVPHAGILLTAFSVDKSKPMSQIRISGIASSRTSLREYQQALSALSYFTNAEIPLSAFAQVADISFTATLAATSTP